MESTSYDNAESTLLRHEPCPSCGSRDNLGRYTDGHGYCFGCGYYEKAKELMEIHTKQKVTQIETFTKAEVIALTARGITEETCRRYNYRVGELDGRKVHFAPYYRDGSVIACKVRDKDKNFKIVGDGHKLPLFGQHLFTSSKMLVVTEGEIDCLSVSQAFGNKWPVVSVPSGAQGAKRSIQQNLEFFSGFETCVFMFDMDEPGQKAAAECAQLLPPGKAKLAHLPLKDANDMLQQGRVQELVQAVWQAKQFRPDGIISAAELWETVRQEEETNSVPYPFIQLTDKTKGLRRGELVTVTAGSGIGKSAFVREIAYHLLSLDETVGMLMLEENPKRTILGMMGIALNKPIHISKEGVSDDQLRTAFDGVCGSGRLYLYDHFGSSDVDNLVERVRYMAKGLGCNWIVLDHLSIVVSGLGDGDERRLIDNAMTMIRTLVEETGIGMILVSHLKRPDGNKGHEEGAVTSLSQLRGSHAIAQLSDIVIGLERNQQSDTPNTTTVRVLKNRFTGDTGIAGELHYNRHTGRLTEEMTVDPF